MISPQTINKDLEAIRSSSPLVHNITNYVVMNSTANALLAVGASPVMAHAIEEIGDMVSIASAVVINMGTLSPLWVESMLAAGRKASEKGKPVVFDPVGAGATPYRTATALKIISDCKPAIIRGNASEIKALIGENESTKGVDSTEASETAVTAAKKLARITGSVVVVSGETDYVTNGTAMTMILNGSPLMPKVTGMGCTASALAGAFAAVNSNFMEAASHAMAVMGVTGEIAASGCSGPGSLQVTFIDTLYNLSCKDILQKLRVKSENA